MCLTSKSIAILAPVYGVAEDDLKKFFGQLARFENKPFVFFAYEKNSCNFDFIKVVSRAARQIQLDYTVKIFMGNKGLGHALNKSVIEIKHPYIARHDIGDDILENRLAVIEKAISELPEFDILYTQAVVNTAGHERLSKCPTTIRSLITAFATKNPIIHPTVVFRRSAILDIGNYNENLRYCEDLDLWLRALKNTLRFKVIDVPTVRYFAPIILRTRENWRTNFLVRVYNIGSPNIFISIIGIFNLILFNCIPIFLQKAIYKYAKR